MNILICGRKNGICTQLDERLIREGHELYYVSGNNHEEGLSKSTFQEYHFSFLNDNINQIIIGARPDTVIINGAMDTNFDWRRPDHDATEFVTSMTSLLMAAQNAGASRVIYLSSTEIYEENKESEILKDTVPKVASARAEAFLRMENLIENFRSQEGSEKKMEIVILRLPPVFGDFDEKSDHICLRFTMSYLEDGVIPCFYEQVHSGIFYKDAVEAVMKIVDMPSENLKNLYQVQGLVFTEKELADTLLKTGWNKGSFTERKWDDGHVVDYPPERLRDTDEEELKFSLRYDLKESIDQLCKSCLKRRKEIEKEKRKSIQLIPIIESVVMAIVTFFATLWLETTWVGDKVNLFILYVLILAVAYGTSHGLLASLLAAAGIMLLYIREETFIQVIANYTFYLQFLQLVVVGVIAGFMRDKYARKHHNLNQEKTYLSTELSDVTRINDNNVYIKNIYEKRLIAYENSLSRIYELTTALDFMESQKVTFQAVRMIEDLMEVGDVAIYTASQRSKFLRLSAASSQLAQSCGKSLKFDEESYLFESISSQAIFLNKENIEGRPMFGGGVYDDDQLLAIILVWTDDIHKVNLYESDMLAIACRLIEKSMARAFLYEDSLRNDTYIEGTNIMQPDAFIKMLDVYEDGHAQGLLEFTTLKILLNGKAQQDAARLVRDTDWVGVVNGVPCIILSNSTIVDAQFVIKRYEEKGMEAVPVPASSIYEEARLEVEKYGTDITEESVKNRN